MRGDRDFSTRPRRRAATPLDVALLGAGLLTLALAGYATATSWSEFRHARRQVAAVRQESEAAQSRLRSLEARSAPTAALATQALLSADAPPPRVLADLASLLPADVKLESVAMGYGDALTLHMQVSARGAGAYETFLQRLETSPLFEDVIPGEESRDGGVRASVQMRHRGAAR